MYMFILLIINSLFYNHGSKKAFTTQDLDTVSQGVL